MQKWISLLIIIAFGSCNSQGIKVEDSTAEVRDTLPADFIEFYDKFHSDSIYQITHVVFPLKGKRTMIDTMERVDVDVEYLASDWKIHKPFINDGSYERNFQLMGGLIMEQMVDKMGLFTVERRWGKIDTSWNLIYYGTEERAWK